MLLAVEGIRVPVSGRYYAKGSKWILTGSDFEPDGEVTHFRQYPEMPEGHNDKIDCPPSSVW
jgi:hypothetical protein